MVPITITIILASIVSFFTLFTYYKDIEDVETIAPFEGEGVEAGLSNTIIFVTLAFIGGIILLFLLRKGLLNLIEKFFAIVMGYSAFVFTLFFLIPMYWMLYGILVQFRLENMKWLADVLVNNYIVLILIPALFSAIFVFAASAFERFKSRRVHNFLMIYIGSQLGALFGIHLETVTILLVLLGLSLYDIYAVFWGPLKAIFQPSKGGSQSILQIGNPNQNNQYPSGESSIKQMDAVHQDFDENHPVENLRLDRESRIFSLPVYQTSRISIGLGDFVFFSMLVSHALMISYYGDIVSPFLLSFAGIIIGAYITFRLLEKKDILPALPVSVILGLVGFITGYWILRI
ncbi:MAG: hypothetical protein ACFFD4_31735 [Candidatus Odinarchaeota archaeon]